MDDFVLTQLIPVGSNPTIARHLLKNLSESGAHTGAYS